MGVSENAQKKLSKTKIISIVSVIGFLLCTLLLLYPLISDRWNRYRDQQLINDYIEEVQNGDPEVYEEELQKARDYNRELFEQGKNIISETDYTKDAYYESFLNVTKTGMMCYIEIPKINVREPIYHYSTDESLIKGIGHIHGSSLPVGESCTHAVLTGHRGLPGQKLFTDLDRLEEGDTFYIHVLNHTLAYTVCDIKVVLPYEVDDLIIEEDRDIITLVTCEPYGVNTHRLLITGQRTEFDESKVENGIVITEKHTEVIDPAFIIFLGFAVFILSLGTIFFVKKLLSKRKGSLKPIRTRVAEQPTTQRERKAGSNVIANIKNKLDQQREASAYRKQAKAAVAVLEKTKEARQQEVVYATYSEPTPQKERKAGSNVFAKIKNKLDQKREAAAYRKQAKAEGAALAKTKKSQERETVYVIRSEPKPKHGPVFYLLLGIAIGGAIVSGIVIIIKIIQKRNEKKTDKEL